MEEGTVSRFILTKTTVSEFVVGNMLGFATVYIPQSLAAMTMFLAVYGNRYNVAIQPLLITGVPR
jgi:hypothetical protein